MLATDWRPVKQVLVAMRWPPSISHISLFCLSTKVTRRAVGTLYMRKIYLFLAFLFQSCRTPLAGRGCHRTRTAPPVCSAHSARTTAEYCLSVIGHARISRSRNRVRKWVSTIAVVAIDPSQIRVKVGVRARARAKVRFRRGSFRGGLGLGGRDARRWLCHGLDSQQNQWF